MIPFQITLGHVLSLPALPWAGVWIAPPLLRPKNMLIFVFWVLAIYSLRSQTEFSLKLLNESFCKKHFAMWAFPLPSTPSVWHQEPSEFQGQGWRYTGFQVADSDPPRASHPRPLPLRCCCLVMVHQVLERWGPGTHSMRGRGAPRSSVLEEARVKLKAHEVRAGLAITILLTAFPTAPPSVPACSAWGCL